MNKIDGADLLLALQPTLILFGWVLALVALARRDSAFVRAGVMTISLFLLLRYAAWRLTSTLPPIGWSADFFVSLLYLATETCGLGSTCLTLLFMSRKKNRTPDVEANKAWLAALPKKPMIDVFICTYNEEAEILERTIIGATGTNYPNARVWILDDGARPWLRELCATLNCGYITRPDNSHAKAGNINYALSRVAELPEPPEFISILDADFVPLPEFLPRAMTLFRDAGVGLVQTPQHFINADPIQTNLAAARAWPDEQRLFFDEIMACKDAWSAAFCCGTSSVIRFKALMGIGGFPTDSVTEDYLVTLRLKETGFRTVYLNERLTLGLAPEGLKEYLTQRGRWCLGFMQIVRGRSGPFSLSSSLSFIDRLSLIDSFLNWTAVYPYRMLGLIVPSLYLAFNIKAMDAQLSEVVSHFMPFFVWHNVALGWLTRGRVVPVMTDVCQFTAAPQVIRAAVTGLFKPRGQKFAVTAKGGDRSRLFIEVQILRLYGTILLCTIAAIGWAFYGNVRNDTLLFGSPNLFWSWYNLIILAIICVVSIELPRLRRAGRFDTDESVALAYDGQERRRNLINLSTSGARIAGPSPLPDGAELTLKIQGAAVKAHVVRGDARYFAIRFENTLPNRIAMTRIVFSDRYNNGIETVSTLKVGRAVASRMFQ